MTPEELIAEARKFRLSDQPVGLPELEKGTRLLLEWVLESFNYERQRASTPARVCRALAGIISSLRDIQRTLN